MTGHLRLRPDVRRSAMPRVTKAKHMTATLSLFLTDAQVRSWTSAFHVGVTAAVFAFLAYLTLLN